jgi:hypothetical protein
LSTNVYDISIWEEIRSIVSWKTDRLVESIHEEISKDPSLAEFQSKHPVPFQLREIMDQRAALGPIWNPGPAASRYRCHPNRRTRAVTEDVLAELIVSNRVLGTTEILLLNHTGCGFTTFTDGDMDAKLTASTGDASPAPMRFFSYKDPEENTREQIKKVRSHPWIAKDVPVRGFIFDVDTGRLSEVRALEEERAA